MWTNQHAHLALLSFNRATRVDHRQPKLRNHPVVLVENASLKDLKTLFRIIGPPEIQTGLVVFKVRSPGYDTIDRDVEWRAEEECYCRFHCERIDVSHPTAIAAARNVAGKRRVDVTVG